jgi:hypothetical protein
MILRIAEYFARLYMKQQRLIRLDIWRDPRLGVTRYHERKIDTDIPMDGA